MWWGGGGGYVRVTLITSSTDAFFTGHHYDNTLYEFLVRAMQDNPDIDRYDVMSVESGYDASRLKDKTDAIITSGLFNPGASKVHGLKELDVPVVVVAPDPHTSKRFELDPHTSRRFELEKKYDKYGVDCVLGFAHKGEFYRYNPSRIKYKSIRWGVEPRHYNDHRPFEKRIRERILVSGALEWRANPVRRACSSCLRYALDIVRNKQKIPLRRRVFNPSRDMEYHYKLRSACKRLPYVDHEVTIRGNESGAYQRLLSRYRAVIAATTWYATIKYAEIPAAGCMTFMEITDRNQAAGWGYVDGKNCIAINEDNYKQRFEEYLHDPDSDRYKQIADAGRQHAIQNFNNDKAAADLVALLRDLY